MDRLAHTCDARRVSHRKVRTRFERDLRHDLDLSTEVHQEGAVRNVYDFDPVDVASGAADRGRDLAKLSGFVVNLYAQCKAVTRVRGRRTRHMKKSIVSEIKWQIECEIEELSQA